MLVLSRKVGERIVIEGRGARVELVVVRVAGGSVRIGVAAPREFQVLREELEARAGDRAAGGAGSAGTARAAFGAD